MAACMACKRSGVQVPYPPLLNLMQNEAGMTKPTAHPRLRLWARPLRGPGGWVGDWYLWRAPDGQIPSWNTASRPRPSRSR